MAANTEILIKRSLTTGVPDSLLQGELAYSYFSNTMFIGTPDGDGVVNVGGQFYTSQIDEATDSATANKLVRRNYQGDASFNIIYGSLGNTFDITPAEYGSQTQIPVITIAANGLITNVTTSTISTTLDIAGDSGTDAINLLNDTLTFAGGAGITSSVDSGNNTVTFDVDDTVVRSNTAIIQQTIDGDLEISGNLIVLGTQTITNTETFNVADPLIYLASNNYTSDVVDIGFVGNYFDGSTQRHAGVFRHAGDKQFYIFDNYDKEPTSNTVNPADGSFRLGNLNTNLTSQTANVSVLLNVTGNTEITGTLKAGLTQSTQSKIVYYNDVSGELTYEDSAVLTPHQIANGSYSLSISGTDGALTTNGDKLTFDQGAVLADNAQNALLFGFNVDEASLSNKRVSIGWYDALTPQTGQSSDTVAIGPRAGNINQSQYSVAIGNRAGYTGQGSSAIAIGGTGSDGGAGQIDQGNNAIAIGSYAGYNTQGISSVALGNNAGKTSQGTESVAIGNSAGETSQGAYSVAVGGGSAGMQQSIGSVAIGYGAGQNDVSAPLGDYAIAIGYLAAGGTGTDRSIVINASGSYLNPAVSDAFYVNPVRYTPTIDATYDGLMYYNANTKEIHYTYAVDGGSF